MVVYKVDRLTRSLADFAKLVELLEAHEVLHSSSSTIALCSPGYATPLCTASPRSMRFCRRW